MLSRDRKYAIYTEAEIGRGTSWCVWAVNADAPTANGDGMLSFYPKSSGMERYQGVVVYSSCNMSMTGYEMCREWITKMKAAGPCIDASPSRTTQQEDAAMQKSLYRGAALRNQKVAGAVPGSLDTDTTVVVEEVSILATSLEMAKAVVAQKIDPSVPLEEVTIHVRKSFE